MSGVGTWTWAQATGGRLRRRDRLELLRQGIAARISALPERGELRALTSRQGEIRPQSRVALLNRLGFAGLIEANPLNRTATEGEAADGA